MRRLASFVAVLMVLVGLSGNCALGAPGDVLQTYTNPDPDPGDLFGASLASIGNDLFIGVPGDNSGRGVVYRFDAFTGAQIPFANPPRDPGDSFGYSIATWDSYLLVGAFLTGSDAGAAWLYNTSTDDGWRSLSPSPPSSPGDYFGVSVAGKGNEAFVGASGAGSAGVLYRFDVTTREQLPLTNPPPAGSDYPKPIAVVGDKVLAGAVRDSSGAYYAGAAWLFNNSDWDKIANPAPQPYDFFGHSVAAVGDNFVVGGHRGPTWPSAGNPGVVYLFDSQRNQLHRFDGVQSRDGFGGTAAAVGNDILIGAADHDASYTNAGIAYVFDGSAPYSKLLTLQNPEPSTNDHFGGALAAVGNNPVVGAAHNNGDVGAAYLFEGVPEPSTLVLLSIGTLALLAYAWRKRRCR